MEIQTFPNLNSELLFHEFVYPAGATRSPPIKFLKVLEIPIESYRILLNFKPRSFSEFSFIFHFESQEVPIEKVVPFFKTFTTIFYFKFFELGKALFGLNKILKEFKLNSKSFESV
jgi:hypothetical protein